MAKNGEGPVLPQVGDHLPHTLEQDGFLGGVKIFFHNSYVHTRCQYIAKRHICLQHGYIGFRFA